jgi:ribosomal protein S18 acetylase RimI-like enzyme
LIAYTGRPVALSAATTGGVEGQPLAFVEQYDDDATRGDRYWQDRVERSATGRMSSTFVAVHAGTFIGKASCFVEPDITKYVSAHVVGVYVTPRFRGQLVAEALMAAILRRGREEAGAARIRLFVTDTNNRAAAFYRRVGFVPTGATEAYPRRTLPSPSTRWSTGEKTDASASAAPRALGIKVDSHLLYAVACRCRLLGAPKWFRSGGAADDELDGHDDPGWIVPVRALPQVPAEVGSRRSRDAPAQ